MAVDVKVLILAELDVLVVGGEVIVLVVALEAREMSAAITSQKKPVFNSMAANLVAKVSGYPDGNGAEVGVHGVTFICTMFNHVRRQGSRLRYALKPLYIRHCPLRYFPAHRDPCHRHLDFRLPHDHS